MPLRCILTCTPLVVSIFDLRAGTLLVFSLGNDTPLIVCFFGLALGFFRFFSFATILQNSVRTLGGKTTEALFFKNLLPLLLQWFVFWLYNFETLFGIILQRSPLSHHTTLLTLVPLTSISPSLIRKIFTSTQISLEQPAASHKNFSLSSPTWRAARILATARRPQNLCSLDLNSEVSSTTGRRSEEHTSELQSLAYLVCRLLLEKKK